MGVLSINYVPRYFEPYVNDCFANAYGALLLHKGLDPKVMLAEYLCFEFDEESGFIGSNYLYRYSTTVMFSEKELNTSLPFIYFPPTSYFDEHAVQRNNLKYRDKVQISFFVHDDNRIAEEHMKRLLDSAEPVIAVVDLYEMSYHRAYQKEHGLHAVVVTGYDEDNGTYELFDKYELSSSDFDGTLPKDEINRARTSNNPVTNPVVGDTDRPIRNLWMEVSKDDSFRIKDEQLIEFLQETCLRMHGCSSAIDGPTGLDRMNDFRVYLLALKDQTLDERAIFMFRTYYNTTFKRLARHRKRFNVFIQEAAHLLPKDMGQVLMELMEDSAKRLDICANISLKLGITKSKRLLDDIDKHLNAIIEVESQVIGLLESAVEIYKKGSLSTMGIDITTQIREALQAVVAGVENRELTDDSLLADLGIDSIKYVELLVLLEEKCNILFDESDLGMESLRTIGELTALIDKTLAQQVN